MSPYKPQLAAVEETRPALEAALAARADAVPPLVEAVRTHAPHERAPCEHVTGILERAVAQQSAAVEDRAAVEDELQIAVAGLERVGDAYGAVRAAPDYRNAQNAFFLARKAAREAADAYNAAVAEYNAAVGKGGRLPWARGGGEQIAPFGTPESE